MQILGLVIDALQAIAVVVVVAGAALVAAVIECDSGNYSGQPGSLV